MDDWEKRPDGQIALQPITGFSTAVAGGMAIMLRIESVPDKEALRDGRRTATQLVLTPAQAVELAQVLTQAATRTGSTPTTGTA
nr:hypothetical protein [uncultured Roseococcus sp.]